MEENKKTYSIVQVEFARQSEHWLRRLTRGKETYHSRYVLRDDETGREMAELCFSAKNASGKTISHAIFRPGNALHVLADCFRLGRKYDAVMDKTPLGASIPRLKGVLLMPDHDSSLKILPEYPQQVGFTGTLEEALVTLHKMCHATERLNASGVVFTSISVGEANNCRAGAKAVADASGVQFTQLHKKAGLGARSRLAEDLGLAAAAAQVEPGEGDTEARLQIMGDRLRASVRTVPVDPNAGISADWT